MARSGRYFGGSPCQQRGGFLACFHGKNVQRCGTFRRLCPQIGGQTVYQLHAATLREPLAQQRERLTPAVYQRLTRTYGRMRDRFAVPNTPAQGNDAAA